MCVDDLIEIANCLENTFIKLQEIYKNDYKRNLTISMKLPKSKLENLDHELYALQNGNSNGFLESDEVKVNILGINFDIGSDTDEKTL